MEVSKRSVLSGRPEKLRELKGKYSQGQDIMGQRLRAHKSERDSADSARSSNQAWS